MAALLAIPSNGQGIDFFSDTFEYGVRSNLGLTATDELTMAQLDTISSLDLSNMGITDIRDAIYLPNIQVLDLSHNAIEDVAVLANLEHLCDLDLAHNQLEDVDVLAFSCADSIYVNVAYNKIKDFSLFYTMTPCRFTLIGKERQNVREMSSNIIKFYSYLVGGMPAIKYNVYNTTGYKFHITYGSRELDVVEDGATTYSVLTDVAETTQAVLSNGIIEDTTFVVPPTLHYVLKGDSITLATGLPSPYTVGYASARNGKVKVDGTSITYYADDTFTADTISYTFHLSGTAKGFSELYVMNTPAAISTLSHEAEIEISWKREHIIHIHAGAKIGDGTATIQAYDVSGRLLTSVSVSAEDGIDYDLPISGSGKEIIIIKVITSKKNYSVLLPIP